MTKLNLEFVGFNNKDASILINGKYEKLKKTREKAYTCSVETDLKESEITIYKSHNYIGKNWFWWNLLYFIVSVFGLFDIRQNKKCLVLYSRFTISTENDTEAIIKRQDFEDEGKLVEVETSSKVEEISNVQYYDKEARKRHAKMKKFKIITTIASLVLIVVLAVIL